MITLIFGAGASFGSGRCIPYNPPLGNNLFSKLDALGGEFSKLDRLSKHTFESEGFEAGMATISNNSKIITPLQREVACYLSQFQPTPDNAYNRLFNKLRRQLSKIKIATLNYDLLIEHALLSNGFDLNYNDDDNGISVIKPHGSSNFLPELPVGFSIGSLEAIDCDRFASGLQTKAPISHDEVVKWLNNPKNNILSPVLAMYEKNKRVVINRNLIDTIQRSYTSSVISSNLIIIIGVKYVAEDKHIWEPIENSGASVVIVDPYPDDTIAWAKSKKLSNCRIIKKSFEDSILDIRRHVTSEIK